MLFPFCCSTQVIGPLGHLGIIRTVVIRRKKEKDVKRAQLTDKIDQERDIRRLYNVCTNIQQHLKQAAPSALPDKSCHI